MPRDGSSTFCLYLSIHIHIDKFKVQSNSDVVGKQSSTAFRDSLLRWIQTVSVRWYVEIGVISIARPVHCVLVRITTLKNAIVLLPLIHVNFAGALS